jgi:hypothetical protein
MVVFMYTFTSASSSLSVPEAVGVAIRRGPLPWRSPLDEASVAAAYAGMGWDTSTPLMQLQRNANHRALLRILYTKRAKFRIQDYIMMMLGN